MEVSIMEMAISDTGTGRSRALPAVKILPSAQRAMQV